MSTASEIQNGQGGWNIMEPIDSRHSSRTILRGNEKYNGVPSQYNNPTDYSTICGGQLFCIPSFTHIT